VFALRTSKAAGDINRVQVDHVKEQKKEKTCFLLCLCTASSKHR
jgi:hypothetical protein